jgi:hypothetical protein
VPKDSFHDSVCEFIAYRRAHFVVQILRRQEKYNKRSIPFAEIMADMYVGVENLQASDHRDLVFALLNMCGDKALLLSRGLLPDYSMTKKQVYTVTAMHLINEFGLRVLTWCNSGGDSDEEVNMTSWAPDWSRCILRPFGEFGRVSTNVLYDASHHSYGKWSFTRMSDEEYILKASSIVVDTISAVGISMDYSRTSKLEPSDDPDYPSTQDERSTPSSSRWPATWLKCIRRLADDYANRYQTEQSLREAMWRTPIADQVGMAHFPVTRIPEDMKLEMEIAFHFIRREKFHPDFELEKFERNPHEICYDAIYWEWLIFRSAGRRYFVSKTGWLGLGPSSTKAGDVIVVFLGLKTPMVLRPAGGGSFRIVGEAYIHGIMDGEVMDSNPMIRDIKIC